MPKKGSRPGFKFIIVAHPSDATSDNTIRQIRSHVARDIHARGRRSAQSAEGIAAVARPQKGATTCSTLLKPADGEQGQVACDPGSDATPTASPNADRCRPTTPSLSLGQLADGSACQLHDLTVGIRALGAGRRDPFQSIARPLSELEDWLLDHYVTYVIPQENTQCSLMANKATELLQHWVPFSLGDKGVLAAILLQSCRSIMRLQGRTERYSQAMLRYKIECINSTNLDLARDKTFVSDFTIAKVILMGTEEHFNGNVEVWATHIDAIYGMVNLRGGTDTLGAGGLLAQAVKDCMTHLDGFRRDGVTTPFNCPLCKPHGRPINCPTCQPSSWSPYLC